MVFSTKNVFFGGGLVFLCQPWPIGMTPITCVTAESENMWDKPKNKVLLHNVLLAWKERNKNFNTFLYYKTENLLAWKRVLMITNDRDEPKNTNNAFLTYQLQITIAFDFMQNNSKSLHTFSGVYIVHFDHPPQPMRFFPRRIN